MEQPDLFASRPAQDDPFEVARVYRKCDMCGKRAPGNLYHAHGVPVLFMGDCCDPKSNS